MPVDCKIFVGGGFDDHVTHIVENYAARYATANPAAQVHYHSWKRGGAIRAIIDGLTPQDRVTLIGHSYGGDTAFSVVTATARAVDILVSIDPVGRFRPAWTTIRAKARVWLNVRAEPSAERRTFDDTIAWIGGQYPRPPAPGQAGAPDFGIIANATHGAFSTMMNASMAGRSGRQLLGGNPA
ncbi:alpha/beta hydrolase [Sphingomonas sp.]|jgi:pimeloyl-ACP methyl ester carboxylesterase|uniref:alpha/beta hydrolase n=1 Tax=Sphingomonas sp. TaxID=28214 RepID=UPI002D7FFEFE|nr:alpha/beta hydrolase [Sphingomonas sp.]HEU0042981.1 alpha/beta hydrolase [Sphingomonas sp.]